MRNIVMVQYIDNRIFDSDTFKPDTHYKLRPEVVDWLDAYAGDWGVDALISIKMIHGEFGPEEQRRYIGKIIQFETQRKACLFMLHWHL